MRLVLEHQMIFRGFGLPILLFLGVTSIAVLPVKADPYAKWRFKPGTYETKMCDQELINGFRMQQSLLGGSGSYYDYISTLYRGIAVNAYSTPLSSEDIANGVVKSERDRLLGKLFDATVEYVRINCPR